MTKSINTIRIGQNLGFALVALCTSACMNDSINQTAGLEQSTQPAQTAQAFEVAKPANTDFGGFPEPERLPLNQGLWLAGDLHVHSNYSTDGSNRPMSELMAAAKSAGLGFICMTDHDNHVNGDMAGKTWADPAYKTDKYITVLYGAEWTTGRGHGNVFSAAPYDHKQLFAVGGALASKVMDTVKRLNVHLSANHPVGNDPWGYGYDVVRSIEVWQSANWQPFNPLVQTIWDDQLRTGRRMTGRGGSDSHHGLPKPDPASFNQNSYQPLVNGLGTPTTWVRTKDRSGESIIDAINAGRVSISATPTSPRLVLTASVGSEGKDSYGMGDLIVLTEDTPVTFTLSLENMTAPVGAFVADIISEGASVATLQFVPGQTSVTFTDKPLSSKRTYYRATLQGASNADPNAPLSFLLSTPMVALTNPIYVRKAN